MAMSQKIRKGVLSMLSGPNSKGSSMNSNGDGNSSYTSADEPGMDYAYSVNTEKSLPPAPGSPTSAPPSAPPAAFVPAPTAALAQSNLDEVSTTGAPMHASSSAHDQSHWFCSSVKLPITPETEIPVLRRVQRVASSKGKNGVTIRRNRTVGTGIEGDSTASLDSEPPLDACSPSSVSSLEKSESTVSEPDGSMPPYPLPKRPSMPNTSSSGSSYFDFDEASPPPPPPLPTRLPSHPSLPKIKPKPQTSSGEYRSNNTSNTSIASDAVFESQSSSSQPSLQSLSQKSGIQYQQPMQSDVTQQSKHSPVREHHEIINSDITMNAKDSIIGNGEKKYNRSSIVENREDRGSIIEKREDRGSIIEKRDKRNSIFEEKDEGNNIPNNIAHDRNRSEPLSLTSETQPAQPRRKSFGSALSFSSVRKSALMEDAYHLFAGTTNPQQDAPPLPVSSVKSNAIGLPVSSSNNPSSSSSSGRFRGGLFVTKDSKDSKDPTSKLPESSLTSPAAISSSSTSPYSFSIASSASSSSTSLSSFSSTAESSVQPEKSPRSFSFAINSTHPKTYSSAENVLDAANAAVAEKDPPSSSRNKLYFPPKSTARKTISKNFLSLSSIPAAIDESSAIALPSSANPLTHSPNASSPPSPQTPLSPQSSLTSLGSQSSHASQSNSLPFRFSFISGSKTSQNVDRSMEITSASTSVSSSTASLASSSLMLTSTNSTSLTSLQGSVIPENSMVPESHARDSKPSVPKIAPKPLAPPIVVARMPSESVLPKPNHAQVLESRRQQSSSSSSYSFSSSSSSSSSSTSASHSRKLSTMSDDPDIKNAVNMLHRHISLAFNGVTSPVMKQHMLNRPLVLRAGVLSHTICDLMERIISVTHILDGVEYPNSFTGSELMDALGASILSNDVHVMRHVARSLIQKEIIQTLGDINGKTFTSAIYSFNDDLDSIPTAVFLPALACYCPSCSEGRGCYSSTCPFKLKQTRLASSTLSITASLSSLTERSLYDTDGTFLKAVDPNLSRRSSADMNSNKKERSWQKQVDPNLLNTLSKEEISRQEAIFECVYTEADYVDDLRTILKLFKIPIANSALIDASRRDTFVARLFGPIEEILRQHELISNALKKRMDEHECVFDSVGDIYLHHFPSQEVYLEYCALSTHGLEMLAEERITNRMFSEFLEVAQNKPECRKLPIESFIRMPLTRLGRYSLLLDKVHRNTDSKHADRENIVTVMQRFDKILAMIDQVAGHEQNKARLCYFHHRLVFKDGSRDVSSLGLLDENRQVIMEKMLKRPNNSDLFSILLDNMLLLTKVQKRKDGTNEYLIHKDPMRLQLICILPETEAAAKDKSLAATFSLMYLGGDFEVIQLSVNSVAEKEVFLNQLRRRIEQANNPVFKLVLDDKLEGLGPANSYFSMYSFVSPSSNKKVYAFGCADGLYFWCEGRLRRVISCDKVIQVEVIESTGAVLVLISEKDRILMSFSLNVLEEGEVSSSDKSVRIKLASGVTFFTVGTCNEKLHICAVKASLLNSTVLLFESGALMSPAESKSKLMRLFDSQENKYKKELSIPSEVKSAKFMKKSQMVIGCSRGFEVIDIVSLHTQSFLDPRDPNLKMIVSKKDVNCVGMFYLGNSEFVVCLKEFAIFVDHYGHSARDGMMIQWAGSPYNFIFIDPFIVALDTHFLEVRNLTNGRLEQIIQLPENRPLMIRKDELYIASLSPADAAQVLHLVPHLSESK